jgi:peptidyl-prolyl cis-trans isomerase D
MLRFMRSGQRWLTGLLVVGIGGVFVFFLGLRGPLGRNQTSPGIVVEVGPYSYGMREFGRVRERRERAVQEQLGDQYDPKALSETLDNLAVRQLVDESVLALEASDMGLRAPTREIEQLVVQDASFRDESGHFDKEAFDRFTSYEYGTQHAFLEERRRNLLAVKLLRLLESQPEVSEGEARDAVRRQLEQVRIAFVTLDAKARSEDVKITPEQIQQAIETRADAIQDLYTKLGSRYNAPEQVRARHILLKVPKDATPEQVEAVRKRAEAVLARLRGGEDFAKVAKQVSEDPGSASRGGDLGFFRRGQMVKEFEEAAFALKPGQLSGLVRTPYGFHVIRVEERKAAVDRPLDQVRGEVAEELLRREAANLKAREVAERIAKAIRGGQSLEQAARAEDLTLERSGWLTRRADGFVPGLGPAQDLLATAFVLEPGHSSPRIFEVADKLALVQLLERKEPEAADVAKGLDDARKKLLDEKRMARTNSWVDARRDELIESGHLKVNLKAIQ